MKISLFHKFFLIIFISLLFFQYLNIKVDYKTALDYHIRLVRDKENEKLTTQIVENQSHTIDELISLCDQTYTTEGFAFHVLVEENTNMILKEYHDQKNNKKLTDGYHEEYLDVCRDIIHQNKNSDYYIYKNGVIIYHRTFVGHLLKDGTMIYQQNEIQSDLLTSLYIYDFYYMDSLNLVSLVKHEISNTKYPLYLSIFLLAFVLSLSLSKLLTRKITRISEATEKLSAYDFDDQLKDDSYDELGILAANLNQMRKTMKQTTEHLNEEIQKVKELETLRKEFVANFTHEIKTPLGIIKGYTELLETEQKQAYYDAITKESGRINELVQAMNMLVRLERGDIPLKISTFSVENLLTDVIQSYLPLLKKKQLHLEVIVQQKEMMADQKEMEKVMRNFLSNAIKHTPRSGKITISYEKNLFSIENEGKHLNRQDMERIFETYVSDDREGTGLGLAICKAILDLHGFVVGIKNTPSGVCFYFKG